jgi:chromosome segregation ATPase
MYQQVLTERDSAIAVRNKLESLCRELQRQNKLLMDECKRVASDGQNMRLELSGSFQVAIKEVSVKLEEQKNECLGQLKENEMLRTKLKHLADQYALSEQQYAQKLKQKTLELQIADLKMKQHEEKILQEQSQMKIYAEQVSQLLGTEKNLRLQLTSDGEKFQQFQEALAKSNEVFETFKQEIEKMTKSIKGLKKENAFLKSKSEKSDVTLIELVDEREGLKKQLEKTKNQKAKLESLCRSMQAERKEISAESNNTDSVPA